jgi:AraC-like DNA-binding protein
MMQPEPFIAPPAGLREYVLGIQPSRNVAAHPVTFSVPAHVFATLNVVQGGTLSIGGRPLPRAFATGAHTRARSYTVPAGAWLATLFCRAEAIPLLCGGAAADFTDGWFAADKIFRAFTDHGTPSKSPQQLTIQLFACVSQLAQLAHLDEPTTTERNATPAPTIGPLGTDATRLLTTALDLWQQEPSLPMSNVAQHLALSLRGLQRLFQAQWGVSPKLVQRLLRLAYCTNAWESGNGSLADLAAEAGLADQAHLAREFRALVGHPPRHLKHSSNAEDNLLWALKAGHAQLMPRLLSRFSKTRG